MPTVPVLNQLQEMGIHLSAHGETIRAGPKSAIMEEARRLIGTHKVELLEILRAVNENALEAAHEAAQERAAIVEYEAGLNHQNADAIAELAENFYRHLFGPAKETGCCCASVGRYCAEGEMLRLGYYNAAATRAVNQRKRRRQYGR